MPVGAQHSEVAGAEAAPGVEGRRVEAGVGVAREQHRPAHPHLALDAGGGGGLAPVGGHRHDRHLAAVDRAAVGVSELVVAVVGRALRDHRALGHAVPVGHGHAHLLLHPEIDLRRLGGAAARQHPQGGQGRAAAGLAGLAVLLEEHLVEDRRPAGHGHSVTGIGKHRRRRVEALDEHRSEPGGEHRDHVVGTADVGVGEGDGAHIVAAHVQGPGQPDAAGDERGVRVLHALGVGGGPRGVVQPPHRVGVRIGGGRRKGGRVAFGQVVVADHHPRLVAEPGDDLVDHGPVVESTPHSGMHHHLGSRLLDAEADLAMAVDVDDGVLDRSQPAEGEAQQHRLDAGWQQPRHRGAGSHAHGLQAGSHSLSPVLELREGHRPACLVDQHHPVAGRGRPLLEKLPEGSDVVDRVAHGRSV